MISSNDIEKLLEQIKRCPVPHYDYEWLERLLKEIQESPMTAIQIAMVKSPKITDNNL